MSYTAITMPHYGTMGFVLGIILSFLVTAFYFKYCKKHKVFCISKYKDVDCQEIDGGVICRTFLNCVNKNADCINRLQLNYKDENGKAILQKEK